jgi:protein gp37
VRSASSTWKRCLSQDRKAAKDGVRRRIFCSELSDVFDNQASDEWRADLWELIRQCPNHDWLILTKRIQNVPKMVPHDWPLPNVWLGVTAGTQVGWNRDVERLTHINWLKVFNRFADWLARVGPDRCPLEAHQCASLTERSKR